MGWCGAIAQGGCDPYQLIPLLSDQFKVHCALKQLIKTAIVLRPVHLIERLFTHVEAWHQAIAEEMTEAKELIGVAMGIDKMFLGPQDRIVVQQSIEHIRGFAQSTGNDLRMEHAVLIRNVRIDGHRLIVIAEIARIKRAQEGTGLEPEALPIGRGHGAIAPDGTEG